LEDGKPTILWMSNSPLAPTGYGVVTKNVCLRLKRLGWPVSILAFWGLEGSAIQVGGVTVYPKRFTIFGEDAARLVISHNRPDIFITLFDVWVGADWLPALHPRWLAYTPVDHKPLPPLVFEALERCYKPIAMSKFGLREMEEAGIKAEYIPHGVDTKIFKPMDKAECREALIPKHKDHFVVGINAANKGERKDFPRMFAAFRRFLDDNPDAKALLYVNAFPIFPEGLDLCALAKSFGLEKNCVFVNEYKKYVGISDEGMARWYNACDVFMNLARGEGFCLPLIEAQACGVPAIATDFSSMTELVEGHGWLVPPESWNLTPLMAFQAIASAEKAAEALGEAYSKTSLLEKYSKASREFALGYDWDEAILPLWDALLKREAEKI